MCEKTVEGLTVLVGIFKRYGLKCPLVDLEHFSVLILLFRADQLTKPIKLTLPVKLIFDAIFNSIFIK